MSLTVTVGEAQTQLPELIARLTADNQVVIVQGDRPVAELRSTIKSKLRPQFGACKGMLTIVSEDDEHLRDFAEYM
jgi:antitoxin (DNA-binding transcriptional repressor) of toxin-antitoxin stability system